MKMLLKSIINTVLVRTITGSRLFSNSKEIENRVVKMSQYRNDSKAYYYRIPQ